MNDTRKNTKDTKKKEKQKLKQSFFFLNRNLQKVKKNISTPNEKTEKKRETWKTYGNKKKDGK